MDNRQEVLALSAQSIESFGKLFMSKAFFAKTPDFHRNIYRDLEDDSIKRLGIVAPRGHSKSTVTSILFPMWRILFKPREEDLLILLVSESQAQAMNFLSVIKHNLAENRAILHYFGSLEGSKWSEDEIVTSNGARVIAKGTGQRLRGILTGRESITRPNLIILDDFESETNSGTPEAIAKNKNWIAKAVEPSLADGGRLVAIGTIINQAAYLVDIQSDDSWKTHFYQAAIDNDFDRPLWPERFPPERLKALKASYESRGMGDAFWQEYQNTPIDLDNQTFKPASFRYWAGEFGVVDGLQPCLRFESPHLEHYKGMRVPITVGVGVDLAISEGHKADWTVIAPMGMDAEGYRYILPYVRLKSRDIDVIVEQMVKVCVQYRAYAINIETTQFQQAVATAFRKAMLETGLYIGIKETKPRTSKDSRIRSLQPIFSSGKILHRRDMTELEAELTAFPGGAHEDILDAIYMANDVLVPPEVKPFKDKLVLRDFRKADSWLVL